MFSALNVKKLDLIGLITMQLSEHQELYLTKNMSMCICSSVSLSPEKTIAVSSAYRKILQF
jgi:hypothetical protein